MLAKKEKLKSEVFEICKNSPEISEKEWYNYYKHVTEKEGKYD